MERGGKRARARVAAHGVLFGSSGVWRRVGSSRASTQGQLGVGAVDVPDGGAPLDGLRLRPNVGDGGAARTFGSSILRCSVLRGGRRNACIEMGGVP